MMDEIYPLYKKYVYMRLGRRLNVRTCTANLKVQEIICTYEYKNIQSCIYKLISWIRMYSAVIACDL